MGRTARAVGAATVVLVVGAAVWAVAVVGVAQWTEDVCFADLDDRPAHGSYRTEVTVVPPSYVCHLRGRDVPEAHVGHPVVAWVSFGAVAAPPIATVVASLVVVARVGRRPQCPTGDRTGA